jgi:hypothetical protein
MQKNHLVFMKSVVAAAIVLVTAGALSAPAEKKSESAAPGKDAPKKPREIRLSVFEIPRSPAEGRDPFFPRKTSAVATPQQATPTTPAVVIDPSSLVLNGITSPPRRTAMINGHTFEVGEEADLRLPTGGKLLLKCEEITDEGAKVLINGILRRELRLRNGI